MNKQEAAALLGVSVRTLESYVAQNRLSVRYIKGKTRPVADFETAQLEHLRDELAGRSSRITDAATPQNAQNAQNPVEPRNSAANPAAEQRLQLPGTELARVTPPESTLPLVVLEAGYLQNLLQAAGAASNLATSQNPQNLAAKLLLTLAEAQILTGLSRETLKRAIAEGALPARQMGRAWRLRPEDLRDWLRDSFDAKGENKR